MISSRLFTALTNLRQKRIRRILPLFPRADNDELIRTRLLIEKECEQYGMPDKNKLVPHDKKMFFDNLHPNVFGAETYAENLCKFITDNDFL